MSELQGPNEPPLAPDPLPLSRPVPSNLTPDVLADPGLRKAVEYSREAIKLAGVYESAETRAAWGIAGTLIKGVILGIALGFIWDHLKGGPHGNGE